MDTQFAPVGQQFPCIDDVVAGNLRRQLAHHVQRVCPPRLAASRDDLVQAALIRVLRVTGAEGGAVLSLSYLRKVAMSVTIDEIRRHRRRLEDALDSHSVDDLRESLPGPEDRFISAQLGRAIRDGLARLGEDRRLAVTLYLRGYRVPEAAKSLGWSVKRVANLTHRGLRDLRRDLTKNGFDRGFVQRPSTRRRRLGLAIACALVIALVCPQLSEAAPIQCADGADPACAVIGELAWSRDVVFNDIFAVNNFSDFTSFPGDFSSLSLQIVPGGTVFFNDDPLAPGGTTETFDALAGVTSASLSFLFRGSLFGVALSDSDLQPDPSGSSFAAALIYARQSVPEPSSLLSLCTALAMLRWSARRRRSLR